MLDAQMLPIPGADADTSKQTCACAPLFLGFVWKNWTLQGLRRVDPQKTLPSQGASFSFRGWVLPSLWRMRVVSNAWFQRTLGTSACRWPRCPNWRSENFPRTCEQMSHVTIFCHEMSPELSDSWMTSEWLLKVAKLLTGIPHAVILCASLPASSALVFQNLPMDVSTQNIKHHPKYQTSPRSPAFFILRLQTFYHLQRCEAHNDEPREPSEPRMRCNHCTCSCRSTCPWDRTSKASPRRGPLRGNQDLSSAFWPW